MKITELQIRRNLDSQPLPQKCGGGFLFCPLTHLSGVLRAFKPFGGYFPITAETVFLWASTGLKSFLKSKGEKAISILAPCPHKKRVEVVKVDGTKDEKEIIYTTYRAVPVFDISQTDGKDLPEICTTLTGGVQGYTRLLEVLSSISPIPVTEGDARGANGFYSRSEKRIVIQQGMSEAQTIKTTVHEIAHSMMHSESGKSRETEEVEAESVAFTVCNYLGIDSGDYSFGYIAGWFDGDINVLSKSLAAIQQTAHSIIEGIEKGLAA